MPDCCLLPCVFVLLVLSGELQAENPHPDVTDKIHLSSNNTYGISPHTVRLNVNISSPPVDFRTKKLFSWHEDKQSNTTLEDGGATLHMVGNTAKMIEVDYNVTLDTFLEFDFRCDLRGEVHAIGFDNGAILDDAAARRMFVLYGTEWPTQANLSCRHYNPTTYRERWMHFRIPVGQVYQGIFKNLVFMNDHDVKQPTADSRF